MVAYIYQKLVEEGIRAGQVPAKTTTARNWFRSLAEQTSSSPNQIINTAPTIYKTQEIFNKILRDIGVSQNVLKKIVEESS